MAQNIGIQGMLDEAGWLRGLAASLIGDTAQAEDLVQDTWLAALRQPPRAAGESRPWLARVVRNLARNSRRDRSRRTAREEFAHEERAHPSPDALAQQAEAQRLLAEAVTRLAEPLRDAIVLRYFQGLDSSAAAARLGVPASTVRTRLQRALEELRADLDRSFEGGRAGWGMLLVPLVRGEASPTAPAGAAAAGAAAGATAGTLSPAVLASAGGVFALATAGAIYWGLRQEPARSELALAAPPSAVVQAQAAGRQQSSGAREPLDPLPAEAGTSAPTAEAALQAAEADRARDGSALSLSGTILVDGRAPLWPIELTLEPTVPTVASGDTSPRMRMRRDVVTIPPEQGGRFVFGELSPTWSGRLTVSDFSLANGEHSLSIDAPRAGLALALVSGPAVVGRILDPSGRPVPGLEGQCQRRIGRTGERANDEETLGFVCRADGCFRIPSSSSGDWCSLTLRVEAEGRGYLDLETPDFVPAGGRDLGELVLEPLRALAFTVRDPEGAPIEGAFARVEPVLVARRSARTGPDGSGSLAVVPDREVEVRVSAGGYADRVSPAPLAGLLDVVLEPLATLDIGLVGSLPEQADRVRVSAERAAFVWDESGWDERADLQAELGGSRPAVRRWPGADGGRYEYEFALLRYGRVRLVGLVPGVPLTIDALAPDGRVLVTGAASVASQATTTLELGDPRTAGAEPMTQKLPMRRAQAPSPR